MIILYGRKSDMKNKVLILDNTGITHISQHHQWWSQQEECPKP